MSKEPISVRGAKVMIVDDIKENLKIMVNFLELEGYQISFAMNGEKAIKLANLDPPDVILLDIIMPGIDGFETCQRLKSLPNTCDIPIIFITGKSDIEDVVKAFQLGAVDYITKPIQQDEVRVRVKTHLQLYKLVQIREQLIKSQKQQLIEVEKQAALGELVGQLCHEISSPLGNAISAITSGTEQLNIVQQKFKSDELSRTDLEKLIDIEIDSHKISESNLQYAVTLITSFKQVAVDQFSGEKSEFELGHYIKDILNIFKPKLKKTKHVVSVECEEGIILNSYPSVFTQLFINLLNNSLKHGFQGVHKGNISIKVQTTNSLLSILYSDDGRGISSNNLVHIFDKYFTTEKSTGGSGLGLFILREIVEDKLRGTVSCISKENEGAVFLIELPYDETNLSNCNTGT